MNDNGNAGQWLGFDLTLPLLDLRGAAAYQHGHCPDATHLPVADLTLRRHELPAPGTPLQTLHDNVAALQDANAQLQQWGYPIVHSGCLDACALSSRVEWRPGADSRPLWQASAALQYAVNHCLAVDSSTATQGRMLDLACGSGRDALFLAIRGYQVLAIDHKADALQRLQASAAAWRVQIDTACADLETEHFALPEHSFALISVARYLHRPLLPRLREWLAPGGLLVYETFARGAEQFGSPRNPAFLLAPGELAGQFADWQILRDVIQPLPDGRPIQVFIARKPR